MSGAAARTGFLRKKEKEIIIKKNIEVLRKQNKTIKNEWRINRTRTSGKRKKYAMGN